MKSFAYVAFSIVAYAVGLGSLVLFMLFAGGWNVTPWWIDAEPSAPVGLALAVNFGLVALFGLQHTVMARPGFKRAWTKIIPQPLERSWYCLATGFVVTLLVVAWQPLPGTVWRLDHPVVRAALNGLQLLGWTTAVASSFMINHFDLFGLQQVYNHLKQRSEPEPSFTARYLYQIVRHPLQMGFLLGLWATPHMSVSHLFLSALMTCYIMIGLAFEERDLVATLGEDYADYRRRVPMLVPGARGTRGRAKATSLAANESHV